MTTVNRNNRAAKKYLQKVRRSLTCPRKLKKRMLDGLRSDIDTYLEEHPNASPADLTERFGEPAALSESYLSALDAGELAKAVHAAKRTRWVIVVVSILVLLGFIVTFYIMILENRQSQVAVRVYTVTDNGIVEQSEDGAK